jgi:hypothetical protein
MPMSVNSRRALSSISPLSVMEIKRSTRERHGDFEVNSGRQAALFTHCDPGAGQDRVEEISCRLTGTVSGPDFRSAAGCLMNRTVT